MHDGPSIARVAAAIGDRARAEVLSALLAGRALTASELAQVAAVAKPTLSAHLGRLLDARLIEVTRQGRHRYYRLASAAVAALLESLMGVAAATGAMPLKAGPRDSALRRARVCYDHLAGELGVLIYEELLRAGRLTSENGALVVTPEGRDWFGRLEIDVELLARERRALCRPCLDWSERRAHLAGALGAALLARIEQRGWARRRAPSRVVAFTAGGERTLRRLLAG